MKAFFAIIVLLIPFILSVSADTLNCTFQWQISTGCSAKQRSEILDAWDEVWSLSSEANVWSPGGKYQEAFDVYMGASSSLEPFATIIGDALVRQRALFEGHANADSTLFVKCAGEDDESKDNHHWAYAYETGSYDARAYGIHFCPNFFQPNCHGLDTELEAVDRGEIHGWYP